MISNGQCPLLKLNSADNIAIAKSDVAKGVEYQIEPGMPAVVTADRIDLGHKVAIRPIAKGEAVRKYGQLIGFAKDAIKPGDWIHSHNLHAGDLNLNYEY